MSSGDELGRLDVAGAFVAVVEHRDGGRALHVRAGALQVALDLDGAEAAQLAELLTRAAR